MVHINPERSPGELYWIEPHGWTGLSGACSRYPNREEAEDRAMVILGRNPEWIGQVHVRNLYSIEDALEQMELF